MRKNSKRNVKILLLKNKNVTQYEVLEKKLVFLCCAHDISLYVVCVYICSMCIYHIL